MIILLFRVPLPGDEDKSIWLNRPV